MDKDFDVVIIGGGGAGLAAGIMARKAGATVMVLEADTKLGGATAHSAGVMYACNTSIQKSRGIEDTPEAMFDYMMTLSGWDTFPANMRVLAEQSGPALEWLIAQGVQFPPEFLLCSGVKSVPRGHPSLGIAAPLINAAGAAGVEYALGTRVDSLLYENGRVTGISANGTTLRAGAVIVTTGGFGNNPEMLKTYFPTAAAHGDWTYAVHMNAPFILGDGITLGREIGAEIVGTDTGLLLPTSGLGKWVEAFLPPWIMLVNEDASRFMDEAAPYAVSGYLINGQPGQHGFAIFDEPTLEQASQDMTYADPYQTGGAMPTWEYSLLRASIANGKILQADSIEALAAKLGLDATRLAITVAKYNEDCDNNRDTQFFKDMPQRFPIRTAPFYAREVRACVIGQTGAGLNVNTHAQVLNEHSQIIPGLYAAGEVLGCGVGKRYFGGGMGICNAIVFGRIAGTQAAAEALGADMSNETDRTLVVVGAAGGIGLEAVRQLQGQARILAVVQNNEQAAQIAPLVAGSFVCDLADSAAVENLLTSLTQALNKRLDALLVCAAIQPVGPLELAARPALEKLFAVNLFSTLRIVQGLLPLLRLTRGRIVLFSSLAGRVSAPMIGAYAATKFALEASADALRRELHGTGITISLIEPGGVNTQMAAQQGPLVDQALANMDAQTEQNYGALYRGYRNMATNALKFASKPEDVARIAVRAAIGPAKPKPRYLVGRDAQLTVLLARLVPASWLDAIFAKITFSK